jgi:hypothetical protein
VSSDVEAVLQFLEAQSVKQAPRFAGITAPKVLSIMGTTSQPGSWLDVSVHRLVGVEPGEVPAALRVRLVGPLRRAPGAGECMAVYLSRPERFVGYQIKTRPLAAGAGIEEMVQPGPDGITVKGNHVFTVHHSPYALRFFEAISFEEVAALAGEAPVAVVGVGETANLSPRFVFHHEIRDGRLALFHGDGLALKTAMNLRTNRHETRLLLDLDDHTGFLLHGVVEEVRQADHADGWARVQAGFESGGWGPAARVYRFVAETLEPIAPGG